MRFICDCWHTEFVETYWNGHRFVPVFQDEDGQEITHCPACGENLAALWYERPAGLRNYPLNKNIFAED